MAEDVSLRINDVEVSVPDGTTILQAALKIGIDIPHLCYDPALGLPATSSCRLCLVEVEWLRALVASCSHPVAPGMVVRTDSEKTRKAQRMVLELLLSDHPSDCLTCENPAGQAGRCWACYCDLFSRPSVAAVWV